MQVIRHLDFEEDPEKVPPYPYYKISQLDTYHISTHNNVRRQLEMIGFFFAVLLFITKHHKKIGTIIYLGGTELFFMTRISKMFPDLFFHFWNTNPLHLDILPNMRIYNFDFDPDRFPNYLSSLGKFLYIDFSYPQVVTFKNRVTLLQFLKPYYILMLSPLRTSEDLYRDLTGTLYLYPYASPLMRTVLMSTDYQKIVSYSGLEYHGKLQYLAEQISREKLPEYERWRKVLEKYNFIKNWDNCLALYIVDYYLRNGKNINSDKEVGELFMDIINFHIHHYHYHYHDFCNKILD